MIDIREIVKEQTIKEVIGKFFGSYENMYNCQYRLSKNKNVDLTDEQKIVLTYITLMFLPDEYKIIAFESFYSLDDIENSKIVDLFNGIVNFGDIKKFMKEVIELYFIYLFDKIVKENIKGDKNDNES